MGLTVCNEIDVSAWLVLSDGAMALPREWVDKFRQYGPVVWSPTYPFRLPTLYKGATKPVWHHERFPTSLFDEDLDDG